MKCPKCGFNSFEYYDSCSKCSGDLAGYKQTYSITSMVFPQEVKEKLAAEFSSTESSADELSETVETHGDIFSFDLPDDSGATSISHNDDPFNFDEPAADTSSSAGAKSDDDIFADLLETTSQTDESPFGAPTATVPPEPAKAPDTSSGPGEFNLENFSWDDAPASPDSESAPPADDFDSLFGDTKEHTEK